MTIIAPSRRAPALMGQLTRLAQVTLEIVPLRVLSLETGVTNLIQELDKRLGADKLTVLHNNVSTFFDFSRKKKMNVDEF